MMERRVKERLIGATLLVALIVLIVPEMLSGPKPPSAQPLTVGLPTSVAAPTRSVSVDLATSKATAEATPAPAGAASPDAASDGPSPTPSGSASENDRTSESAPPDQAAPASAPTVTTLRAQEPAGSALETPASGPKSSVGESPAGQLGHRGWTVQLGSFASRANAEKLVHQLQAHGGSSPYVSASGSGSSLRYRVRVGPLADRGAAERAAGKLRAAGHPATVVAPAS
jgi:DedD protein